MGESPARFPGDHQPAVRRHGLLLRTSHRTVFRRNPADIHPADAGRQPLQKLRPGGLLHRRGDLVLSGILRRDGVPPVARSAQTENTGIAARDFGIRAQPDRNRHPPGEPPSGRTSTSTTAPGSSSAKRPLSGGTSKFTRASRWAPRLSTKSFRASGVIRPSRTT